MLTFSMGVFVAKYAEITNQDNVVVIDDSNPIPMLIYKGVAHPTANNPMPKIAFDGSEIIISDVRYYYVSWFNWVEHVTIFETSDLNAIPFDISSDITDAQLMEIAESLLVACRCNNGGYGMKSTMSFTRVNGVYKLVANIQCEVNTGEVEFCVYSTNASLKPHKGLRCCFFNQDGKMVFDFLKPPLHILGNCYGGVNATSDPAATYTFAVPDGIDSRYAYITTRSAIPWYGAYKIGSSVSYACTNYKAILTFPNSSTAVVTLRRVSAVNGSNSATAINMFFENLIYCPYPLGKYF